MKIFQGSFTLWPYNIYHIRKRKKLTFFILIKISLWDIKALKNEETPLNCFSSSSSSCTLSQTETQKGRSVEVADS